MLGEVQNSKGQAVFELVAFMPIFIFLFMLMITVGDAINISINQQKATRRYLHYLLKGNSTFPRSKNLEDDWQGINAAGMYAIGFAERMDSDQPIAPCFKLLGLKVDGGEQCIDEQNSGESDFVKIFTTYGVCGNNYIRDPEGNFRTYHNYPGSVGWSLKSAGCSLR